jgi:hypothetical protein
MRGSVAAWRLASSVVGRRTALRYLAIGAMSAVAGSVVAACSSPSVTPQALPQNAGTSGTGGSTPPAGPGSGTASAGTASGQPASATAAAGSSTPSARPGVGALALAAFAAGTWAWSAPDSNYHSGTLVITADGTWTMTKASSTDYSGATDTPSPDTGHWEFSGSTLRVAIDDSDDTAVGTKVPDAVSDGATATVGWQFGPYGPNNVAASWTAAAKTLVLKRDRGPDPRLPVQVITLTRQG